MGECKAPGSRSGCPEREFPTVAPCSPAREIATLAGVASCVAGWVAGCIGFSAPSVGAQSVHAIRDDGIAAVPQVIADRLLTAASLGIAGAAGCPAQADDGIDL
jgi:hypothetical protein